MYSDNNKSQGSVATYLRYGGLALLEHYRSVCGERIFTARAMLSRYMPWPCVCLSVCLCLCLCLSQVGVLLKWLNIGTRKQRRTIAQGLVF